MILIGATTENPYFEVNGALLSRSIIFELKNLSTEDIKTLILRAVNDKEKGMGAYDAVIEEEALDFLADVANGDARAALTAIELGILTTERSDDGKSISHSRLPVNVSRNVWCAMIKQEITITIQSLRLSKHARL